MQKKKHQINHKMVLLIQRTTHLWRGAREERGLSSVNLSFCLLHFPRQASVSNAAVISPSDDPCDLKAECSPTMDNEITAKERGVLEEDNEKEEMDQERDQEEKKLKEEEAEGEEKRRKEQEEEEPLTEEQELEELRAQVLQLLLELDDARETSNKHQESVHELQGETRSPRRDV